MSAHALVEPRSRWLWDVGHWRPRFGIFQNEYLFLYVSYHNEILSLKLKKFKNHFYGWFSGVHLVLKKWFAWEGAI